MAAISSRLSSEPIPERTSRLEHIDMARGLAALFVCIGHLRAFFFIDYGAVSDPGWLAKGFYFATGLGHEAVIVFFVLSGFLVGGKAAEQIFEGRWSSVGYAARRLTRLWVVTAPALLLTLFWDSLGIALGGGKGYEGNYYDILASGPYPGRPADLSAWTFVGNMLFQQADWFVPFGSNQPLWSLSFEFWYYVLGPALFVLVARGDSMRRIAAVAMLSVGALCVRGDVLALGSLWIAGAAAYLACLHRGGRRLIGHSFYAVPAIAVAIGITALERIIPFAHSEYVIGAAWAIALPALAYLRSFGRTYRTLARALSEMSFTLYVVHFPLLAFLSYTWILPTRFQFGLGGMSVFLVVLAATVLYAGGAWWLFERNTDRLRCWMTRRWERLRGSPEAASPSPGRRNVASTLSRGAE